MLVPHPSPRPAGRQDPNCRPVPTHVILTRTIPGLYTSVLSRCRSTERSLLRFYRFRICSLYIPRVPYILAVLYTSVFP